MNTSDRLSPVALDWFSSTILVFWLAAVRGAFEGSSYEWELIMFGGQGMSGDYWFALIGALGSLAVMAGSWRSRAWAFIAIAVWSVVTLMAVIVLAITYADDLRFRGDTMGIDFSLAWIGPLLFGAGSVVSLIAARRLSIQKEYSDDEK